jgi:hypothetical protein
MKLFCCIIFLFLASAAVAQRWRSELSESSPLTQLPYSCRFTDFRNSEVGVFESVQAKDTVRLRRGSYEHPWTEEEGYEAASLEGNFVLGARRVLLVSWMSAYGSSSQQDVVQVLECRDAHWVVTQQIETDAHGVPTRPRFDPHSGRLLLKSTVYGGGAHCCPEFTELISYRWNGERFILRSRKLKKNK